MPDNEKRNPQVEDALRRVDQYASGATSATDQIARELSAVIAQHGQQGRANYEKALARTAQDQQAATANLAATQGARTIGGLDAATQAAITGEAASGYQRAQQDLGQLNKLRGQHMADYGDLVSGYMGMVRDTVPLAREQTRGRILEAEAAEKYAREAEFEDWKRRQEWLAEYEASQGPELGSKDMQLQAIAAGRQARDKALAEQYKGLEVAQQLGNPVLIAQIERSIGNISAKTENDWAREAAAAMFGPTAAAMFEGPDPQNRGRILAEAEWEAFRRDYEAGNVPRQNPKPVTGSGGGLIGRAARSVLNTARGTTPRQLYEGQQRRGAMATDIALDIARRTGLDPIAAERLIFGERIDRSGPDPAIVSSPEYQEARAAAETLRVAGGTKDQLRLLLGQYGYPPEVAAVILDEFDALMNTDPYADGVDSELISDLLGG